MDVAYARKTLEAIKDNRARMAKSFDMKDWLQRIDEQGEVTTVEDFCTTSACIAGQAVLLDPDLKKVNWQKGSASAETVTLMNGDVVMVEDRGANLLGLDDAIGLFYIDDDDEALEYMEELINRVDAGETERAVWEDICDRRVGQ